MKAKDFRPSPHSSLQQGSSTVSTAVTATRATTTNQTHTPSGRDKKSDADVVMCHHIPASHRGNRPMPTSSTPPRMERDVLPTVSSDIEILHRWPFSSHHCMDRRFTPLLPSLSLHQ
ncbi:hypothetical protein PENTCL1PPCAC_7012 [Pristionchus entomophagus]|uniref:Uncharacterized protein n=1 Tax=Pristionchus entomophagus TaxID=358040 RepID=A0AAV5SN87_9BILA|nr:hypothetical protein PENTCL1PPCAC_7012 [Pristionchus entomophagus]